MSDVYVVYERGECLFVEGQDNWVIEFLNYYIEARSSIIVIIYLMSTLTRYILFVYILESYMSLYCGIFGYITGVNVKGQPPCCSVSTRPLNKNKGFYSQNKKLMPLISRK